MFKMVHINGSVWVKSCDKLSFNLNMSEIYNISDRQSLKKKIICVTGGNGFIGQKLIEELTKIGCHVRALTRKKILNFLRMLMFLLAT